VTYNVPGVQQGLKLTPAVLADIFLGEITKWNDPRIAEANSGVSLPDTPITVVHRSDGSGTTNIFTDYLSAVSPAWQQRVGKGTSVNWPVGLGGKGNEGVTGQVKQTPGAIGYVELAYAVQNKLPYSAIQNQAGKFVEPSVDSTTAAAAGAAKSMPDDLRVSIVNAPGEQSYPIAGFTYLLVYEQQADATKGKALVDFVWWALHDGQKFTRDLQYAPLPPEMVEKAAAKVDIVTSAQSKPLRKS
jgi:phosphate transport system substrate-binding protein